MSAPCGCCAAQAPLTPLAEENRPGLTAIRYRVGTYASFRASMLEGIATAPPALAALTTRADDDWSVTLVDLWATVADVLSFYQERYANEAYLRTATQRASVLELATLLDYRPGTGVAAQARLIATLELDRAVTIPAGVRVQSVSPDGAPPQTFETSKPVACDWRLNAPRIQAPPAAVVAFAAGAETIQVRVDLGPAALAALRPGQRLLVFRDGGTGVEEKRIAAVAAREERVTVTLAEPMAGAWGASARAFSANRSFRLFGHAAPPSVMTPSTVTAGSATRIDWKLTTLTASDYAYPAAGSPAESATTLCLDGAPGGLAVGALLLLVHDAGLTSLVRVTALSEAGDLFAGSSGAVTAVSVQPVSGSMPAIADRRTAVIHELVDELVPAPLVPPPAITGPQVALVGTAVSDELGDGVEIGRAATRDGLKPGVVVRPGDLAPGRLLVLDDDAQAPLVGRVAAVPVLTQLDAAGGAALLVTLDLDSSRTLDGASAQLYGNVLEATHGESVHEELLGSGDAAQPFQRFALRKQPLTEVPSAAAGGKRSTLSVRINGVQWDEAAVLYGQPPDAHVYETTTAPDGSTIVQLGDGTTGARAATGTNNVTASYRTGTGLAGRVGARSLTTLLDRPGGLKAVVNPLAATGGADPEALDQVRERAPQSVRTFGRAVSLADYVDLVEQSGEVAKADATWVWSGYEQLIVLTVAGQQAGQFSADDLRRIGTALAAARDVNHPLRLLNFAPVAIGVAAQVSVQAAHERALVADAAAAALAGMLAFDALQLARPVHLSDLYRRLQEVDGVDHVLITRLGFWKPAAMAQAAFDQLVAAHGVSHAADGSVEPLQARLRLLPARPDPAQPGTLLAAELAVASTEPGAVSLTVTGGLTD